MRNPTLATLALALMLAMPAVAKSNSPLTESARAVVRHALSYPDLAIDRGLEGVVMLKMDIEESGEPSKITVESNNAHPILRDAALRSVKRWEFAPATSDGKPVRSTLVIPIRFELLAERTPRSSVMYVPPFRER